jgi:signal transduction histidine kinase
MEGPGMPCADDWAEMPARIGQQPPHSSRDARLQRRGSALDQIEKERARIGRELHSGACQPLTALKLNLEVLESWCAGQAGSLPPEVTEALGKMRLMTDAALEQVRAAAHRLHPPAWQDRPIADALRKLVDDSGISGIMSVSMDLDALPGEPPHASRTALYRCVQECLANTVRHSGATEFHLAMSGSEGLVHLTVRDNGRGIPEAAERGGGIGLAAIGEYADLAGGISRIVGTLHGSLVQISVPLTED